MKSKHSNPAEFISAGRMFKSEDDLAAAVNVWLDNKVDLPVEFVEHYLGHEKVTHRILRRTFASILNILKLPHKALCYILNHSSQRAVKSYVVQMLSEHEQFILQNEQFFSQFIPLCTMTCSDKTLELLTKPIEPELFVLPGSAEASFDVTSAEIPDSKRLRIDSKKKPAEDKRDPKQPSIAQFMFPIDKDSDGDASDVSSILTLSDTESVRIHDQEPHELC